MRTVRGAIFVAINVSIVGGYCYAMAGKLEPLKFHPLEFVILPLMAITAVVSAVLFPVLGRQRERWLRALVLYFGFVLISALYGVYLWILFPDGSPLGVLLAVVGGHLYGWPVFLMVLAGQLLFDRLLFPGVTERDDGTTRGTSQGLAGRS